MSNIVFIFLPIIKQVLMADSPLRLHRNILLYIGVLLYVLLNLILHLIAFLAHLSRKLIGELIGYSWSGVHLSVRR